MTWTRRSAGCSERGGSPGLRLASGPSKTLSSTLCGSRGVFTPGRSLYSPNWRMFHPVSWTSRPGVRCVSSTGWARWSEPGHGTISRSVGERFAAPSFAIGLIDREGVRGDETYLERVGRYLATDDSSG